MDVPKRAPKGFATHGWLTPKLFATSLARPLALSSSSFPFQDNYITFGWSFTDVLVTPTALTINAYCSQNGYTYPVGPTSGIPGDSTQFAWNPYEYEQSAGATPLAEASYTLRIFDERGYYAAPSGGYMSPYIGTIFALYRPQKCKLDGLSISRSVGVEDLTSACVWDDKGLTVLILCVLHCFALAGRHCSTLIVGPRRRAGW